MHASGKADRASKVACTTVVKLQSATRISKKVETEDRGRSIVPQDDSVSFWVQKVRILQDEIRRANDLLKSKENDLLAEQAKAVSAEVSWSKKLQDVQRENYESALRQNKATEQRLISEYDAKIDSAHAEMKNSYEKMAKQNSSTIYKQISGCESLQQELASATAKIGDLEKQNKLLLKEMNLQTSERAKHFRDEVFTEAQEAIEFHKKVAQDAVTEARQQRRALQLEAVKTDSITEKRLTTFEQELNNASAKIADQYRAMAKKAMDDAREERAKSKELILDMEQKSIAQQAEFESELQRQVHDRVSVYKDDVKRLEHELTNMRDHYEKLVQEILSQIQQAASSFESNTKTKAVAIVDSYKRRTEDAYKLLEQERSQALQRELRFLNSEKSDVSVDVSSKARRQTQPSVNRTPSRARRAQLSVLPPTFY